MASKSMQNFVREHRAELDLAIRSRLNSKGKLLINDQDRKEWIMNDEGLYNWARGEGVRI